MLGESDDYSDAEEEMPTTSTAPVIEQPKHQRMKLRFDTNVKTDSNNLKLEFMRVVHRRKAHITCNEEGEVRTLASNFEEVAAELMTHKGFVDALSISPQPGKRMQQVYCKFQQQMSEAVDKGEFDGTYAPYAKLVLKCNEEANEAKQAYKTKKADKRKLREEKEDAEVSVLARTITEEARSAKKKRGSAPPPAAGYIHDPLLEHLIKGDSAVQSTSASEEFGVADKLNNIGFYTISDVLGVEGADLDDDSKQQIVTKTGYKLNKPVARFLSFFDELMTEKAPIQALASKLGIGVGPAADIHAFLKQYYKD